MENTKPVLASKTILSIIVTLAVVAYQLIGSLMGWPEIPDTILEILVGLGLLIAGYGRFAATTKLTTSGK